MWKIKTILLITLCATLLLTLNSCDLWRFENKQDPVQISNKATQPCTNFLYATNASIPGRIYMTINPGRHKTCINTITSFFNKYHTCSNCEDFVAHPEKWHFVQVATPQIGDMLIQHDANNRAYHAVLLVDIKDGEYYVNHAVRTKYYKNTKIKNKNNLSFYRYIKYEH